MMLVGFLVQVWPLCTINISHNLTQDLWQELTHKFYHTGVDDAQGASLLDPFTHFICLGHQHCLQGWRSPAR